MNQVVFCFTVNGEVVHSWNSVKGQLSPSEQINAEAIQSDTHLSFPICEPSFVHTCLPGQPVNHKPPLSHGAASREWRKRRWGWMVGWKCLKLSQTHLSKLKIPPESLELLKCMTEFRPHFCSHWHKFLSFTSSLNFWLKNTFAHRGKKFSRQISAP